MERMNKSHQGQEDLFIDRAAHLFLALAGIKPLPKEGKDKRSVALQVTNPTNDDL